MAHAPSLAKRRTGGSRGTGDALIDYTVKLEDGSGEEAFTVTVVDSKGQPKTELPQDQRWRAATFNYYDRGKWQNRRWANTSDQRRMGRMVIHDGGPIEPFVRSRAPGRGLNGRVPAHQALHQADADFVACLQQGPEPCGIAAWAIAPRVILRS